jgi:outer membrane protein OmpA-like peptidoglycan-associated protein
MLKFVVILASGAAAVLLGACTEQQPGMQSWIEENVPQERYQVAKRAEPTGSAFNRHLYEGYIELSERERAEYDWGDSRRFANKALAAAEGQIVNPEPLYDRNLPADTVDELAAASRNLTSLFDQGARSTAPADAALAQVSFDCWMQEQEENHQPEDIAACRDAFYDAVGRTQTAMAPRQPDYVVYFSTDSTKLAEQQLETVMAAAAAAKGAPLKVLVSGYTDTTGPDARNVTLSEERAEAVKMLLLSAGLKTEQIEAAHYGAAHPAVETGPGKPEPKNRRVEIKLVQ